MIVCDVADCFVVIESKIAVHIEAVIIRRSIAAILKTPSFVFGCSLHQLL